MSAQRTIKRIHNAVRDDIADLKTYRALPTSSVDQIDPFLFLNHHGFQVYPPENQGLPFGPHPHRGFETVTFILKGDIEHQDSGGHRSVIEAGGVQWMTAGKGLIHSEVSSANFKKRGGELEILQLWVNLPTRLKMTKPRYLGLQKNAIPQVALNQKARINLIAGSFENQKGPVIALTDLFMSTLEISESGHAEFKIPSTQNIFLYVVSGSVLVQGTVAHSRQLIEFSNQGEDLRIEALDQAVLLFAHAEPFQEPVVAHGPFVMNTREEIVQAIQDYQAGLFGENLEVSEG